MAKTLQCVINVTLGSGKTTGEIPGVGNNVVIYTGAVVSGETCLNNGCTVRANSYVNRDVEPNTVVVGVPAKLIGS